MALARVASETPGNQNHKSFWLMARSRDSVLNWHRMSLLLTSANTEASAQVPPIMTLVEEILTTASPSPEMKPTLEATPTSFLCQICAEEPHARFAGMVLSCVLRR